MDMDMDIPLPEELEWLEANSHLQEEYDEFEPADLYHEEKEEQQQQQNQCFPKSPLSGFPDSQINGQKRPRSEGPVVLDSINAAPPDEKRTRTEPMEAETDEDWLRYSPSQGIKHAEEQVAEENIVSRYASEIDGDCIPVTGPGGDRVYVKIGGVEKEGGVKKLGSHENSAGLILEPINVLLEKVERDAFMKALQASSEENGDVILSEAPVANDQLWVDKYAPNSFTELLSDEQTNREVLLWLKQWDSCVFGSEIKSTTDEVLSALRRHSSIAQHQKPDVGFLWKNRGPRFSERTFGQSYNLDKDKSNSKDIQELRNKKSRGTGPPEQKILLLCGPPGLGKTTLAHVAAKHCGYLVVEINASDDRSSSTIEAKILDVVQMNSVMADSKPKCLVIDEIDGALGDGKGAVEVILKMVSAEGKFESEKGIASKEEQSRSTSSKKRRKTKSLSRPVICICNDLYAPALRPLRQVAKVHLFVQPTLSRVVSRLKYICNKEGVRTSAIALTALAEYTECDVRACLNTLQFLKRKKEALNLLEISSQVVGRKDISRGVFDVWKEIFQKRKLKQERKSDHSCSSLSNRFDFLLGLISNRGDYDLILDGIHENILQLHCHDPLMQKTVKSLNNLGVSDLVQQYIMRTQHTSLYVYQPPIAIYIHHLIACVERPTIEWPKSFHRSRTLMMEKSEILRSWHSKITPCISRHLSVRSFVEDSVSPFLHILSPPSLRPVAVHLLSEKEKNDLAQLVSTMVSYSITYKNIKIDPLPTIQRQDTASDFSALSFEPPIPDFINFEGYRSIHSVLTLPMKQVLIHEVGKQRIVQQSMGRSTYPTFECEKESPVLTRQGVSIQSAKFDHMIAGAESMENVGNKVNTSQSMHSSSKNLSTLSSGRGVTATVKLKSPGDVKKPSNSSSFFDRFRKISGKGSQNAEVATQKPATLERDSRPFLFKFNEGFTNAVKRPVRIREFLL